MLRANHLARASRDAEANQTCRASHSFGANQTQRASQDREREPHPMSKSQYPREEYPREVRAFVALQKRVAGGYTTTSWPRTLEGFHMFLASLGEIPRGMKWPSVGRKNHSLGYTPKNCAWEEFAKNGREAAERFTRERRKDKKLDEWYRERVAQGLRGKKKSVAHCRAISIAARNRSSKARRNISLAQRGKKLSEATRKKISLTLTGRKHSKRWKQNIAKALKGKKFTARHRRNISIAARRREERRRWAI